MEQRGKLEAWSDEQRILKENAKRKMREEIEKAERAKKEMLKEQMLEEEKQKEIMRIREEVKFINRLNIGLANFGCETTWKLF